MRVTVAGAGMAGLVCAARLRELGHEPVVVEKGTRAGGSMLLSSCVVWRYADFETFRAECPGGDATLQRLVHDRFDDALEWLERLGPPVVWTETGNPRTVGKRFDPRGLTDVLLRAAGPVRLEAPLADAEPPLILCTGGFSVRFARERGLLVRSNPWSDGGGIDHARRHGAAVSAGMDEFYGRNMPAPPARFGEADYVPLAQLYGRWATVLNERGEEFFDGDVSWSETDLVQATARQPGATAWYVVDEATLERRVRDRSVREMVDAAIAAGATVTRRDDSRLAVHVMPGVTHTIGGLRVDTAARVLDGRGATLDGLYAAGADVGGVSTGGYFSGLAGALVLGLTAAESVARH